MLHSLLIPLQVMVLGIIISYGIAAMMKLILVCIRSIRTGHLKKINKSLKESGQS